MPYVRKFFNAKKFRQNILTDFVNEKFWPIISKIDEILVDKRSKTFNPVTTLRFSRHF